MTIEVSDFGKTSEGEPISLFTIRNQSQNVVELTNYGAIIVSVCVPDRDGTRSNVNLGFQSLDGYLERHPYFGSTVGRFCNRIASGWFLLDGKSYTLAINNGPNHLHGGIVGFDKKIWSAEVIEDGVRFSMTSPDGDEGYPGELRVTAEYRWNDLNELSYCFRASCDAATVLNLTNHAYWNLGGIDSGSILNHEVKLFCDRYLAVDDTLIPTGEIVDVADTPLDFHEPHALGERIELLSLTKGYDHCYVVNGPAGQQPRTCGIAYDPQTGRQMEVLTTQPGMQLYTGNHLDGGFEPYSGFCFETQHYPDSPNQPDFPTTCLKPGETFQEETIHRFTVRS